jgi:hypothetical protein
MKPSLYGSIRSFSVSKNPSSGVPVKREPQPSRWNEMLRQRDGVQSHCAVTLYCSVGSPAPRAIRDPKS